MGFWNSINTAFNSVANVGTNILGTVLNSSAANAAVGSLLGGSSSGSGTAGGTNAVGSGNIGGILSGLFGSNTTPQTSNIDNNQSNKGSSTFNPIWLLLPFGLLVSLIFLFKNK